MPPDPKRLQSIFLAAVEADDRAAVLDRECDVNPAGLRRNAKSKARRGLIAAKRFALRRVQAAARYKRVIRAGDNAAGRAEIGSVRGRECMASSACPHSLGYTTKSVKIYSKHELLPEDQFAGFAPAAEDHSRVHWSPQGVDRGLQKHRNDDVPLWRFTTSSLMVALVRRLP